MLNNLFLHFVSLFFLKDKRRYLSLMIISTVVVFLLSVALFISSSIKHTLIENLQNQPDFIVQKVVAGESSYTPLSWQDKILDIPGIGSINARVYGRYNLDSKKSILIIGIDPFDEQTNKSLKEIIDSIDLKAFLKEKYMIIGAGVDSYLKSHFFNDYYNFLTPKGELKRVKVFKVLSPKSAIFSNDVAILPINLAKEILGIKKDSVSDFAIDIPNSSEEDTIKQKIESLFFNARVVSKRSVREAYESLYDYKSGIFLALFIVVLTTFTLILYLRYTIATSIERREIGIFRAVGWSIKDVIKLKFLENLALVVVSFILGVSLAYIYTFIFNAPIALNIFLDKQNLKSFATLDAYVEFGVLASIFIIFAISFLATALIPIWKIATTDPKEAMR